jgi:hypothetical protein
MPDLRITDLGKRPGAPDCSRSVPAKKITRSEQLEPGLAARMTATE